MFDFNVILTLISKTTSTWSTRRYYNILYQGMCWSIGDKYIRGTPNFLSRRLKPLQNYWPISGDRVQLIKFAARPPRCLGQWQTDGYPLPASPCSFHGLLTNQPCLLVLLLGQNQLSFSNDFLSIFPCKTKQKEMNLWVQLFNH